MNHMRNIFAILSLMFLLAVSACGDEEGFVIKCEIEGLDTKGLEMVYMTRGGVSRQSFHPVDGKVELRGMSAQPTLVEVFTLDGNLLFSCVASDGDRMKLKMKLGDPSSLTVSGQDATRDFTAFVAQHDSLLTYGSDAEVNRLIADAVRANPSSMASTLLMVTRFRTAGYELEADSLLSEIAPEARPTLLVGAYASAVGEQVSTAARGEIRAFTMRNGLDTIVRYTPGMQSYVLMAFNDTRKPDSVARRMRALRDDLNSRRLKIIEISVAVDSAVWRGQVKGDSANWMQAWAPGGVSSQNLRRMAIPRLPYYIVADSTGAQRYRGTSVYTADTLLRSLLRPYLPKDSVAADSVVK